MRVRVPLGVVASSFDDVPAGSQYSPGIEWAKQAGLTAGCSANPPQFCPDRPATRAEVMTWLYRLSTGATANTGGSIPPGEPINSPSLDISKGFTLLGYKVTLPVAAGGVLGLVVLLRLLGGGR